MRSKWFWMIFLLGVSAFVAVNLYDYWQTTPVCCDFSSQFGWPFALGNEGGFIGATSIRWQGLLLDALIAVFASMSLAFILAGLLRRVFRKS